MTKKGLLHTLTQVKSKLAGAMRQGAKKRPQARGNIYADNRTCALGAALEGELLSRINSNGIQIDTEETLEMYSDTDDCIRYLRQHGYQEELDRETICPCGCGEIRIVSEHIPHLNDEKKWTRGRIANWLDKLAGKPGGCTCECGEWTHEESGLCKECQKTQETA